MDAPLQLALPFSLKEAVSVRRAASILGVDKLTVYRLLESRSIEFFRRGERGLHQIRWCSLVSFCDGLRETYGIPNRRPQLSSPIFRHNDRDIPPFPLSENLTVQEVMSALQLERTRVIAMANFGQLEAYQLTNNSPWRFYRPSVAKYISDIHQRASMRRPASFKR